MRRSVVYILVLILALLAGCQPTVKEPVSVPVFGELTLPGDMAAVDVCGDLIKVDIIRSGLDGYAMDTVLYSLSQREELARVSLPEDSWETGCLVDGFYTASLTSGVVTRYNTAGKAVSTRTLDAAPAFVQMSRSGRYILYGARVTARLLLLDTADESVRNMGGFAGYIQAVGVEGETFYMDVADDGLLCVSPEMDYAACVMVDGQLHRFNTCYGVGRTEEGFLAVSTHRPEEMLAIPAEETGEELTASAIPGFATVSTGTLRLYLPKETCVLSRPVQGTVQSVVTVDGDTFLLLVREGDTFRLELPGKAAFDSREIGITTVTRPTAEQPPIVTTPPTVIRGGLLLTVPVIPQMPNYPTGCESVSAVMALQYAGEAVTVDDFIDNYLEKSNAFYLDGKVRHGPDPYEVFVGDPRTTGSYGCMAPVIERAMTAYFGSDTRVKNTTGTTLPDLCEQYIAAGRPVLVWVSIGMIEIVPTSSWILPNGELFTWPGNEHCMVLVGYDETHYYLNDPYSGRQVKYPRSLVEARYETMGQQSLVIL